MSSHQLKIEYESAEPQVHKIGALEQLCKPFQSHENGIPEWVKNSSDEYARLDRPENERIIVLVLQNPRGKREASISCLDFGGMTAQVIERDFAQWADPDAARRDSEAQVQGGHGNGGKCYMAKMFRWGSITTVKNEQFNRYGTSQERPFRFGYMPNPQSGRAVAVVDSEHELNRALDELGISVETLPEDAVEAFGKSGGFTLVSGIGPHHITTKVPIKRLVENLLDHPQMQIAMQHCRIHVLYNGAVYGGPLQAPEIEPLPGAEQPRTLAIPEVLVDPATDQTVSTTAQGTLPSGELELRTSAKSLKARKKGNITYRARSGFIGYVAVWQLDVSSVYKDRIYGECRLDALESAKQNERGALSETPLTRAVEAWISERIEEYAREFEARQRRATSQEEMEELSRLNELLDNWKNEILKDVVGGPGGEDGEGAGSGGGDPLPFGEPTKIEFEVAKRRLSMGVSQKPVLRFFDAAGRRIRSRPYRWVSSDPKVIEVDEDLNVFTAVGVGKADVHAETLDGKARSSPVAFEVVEVANIRLYPFEMDLKMHARQGVQAICELADGAVVDDVVLIFESSDPAVVSVAGTGTLFGMAVGHAEVTARAEGVEAETSVAVTVTEPEGGDTGRGRGYPRVFISGVDPDPDTGEVVTLPSDVAPVYQRAEDVERHIWWINSEAPIARMLLDKYGVGSVEWRLYHVDKYVEVMVQIAFDTSGLLTETMTGGEWITMGGATAAEIQNAAAAALGDFVDAGTDPRKEAG